MRWKVKENFSLKMQRKQINPFYTIEILYWLKNGISALLKLFQKNLNIGNFLVQTKISY